MTYLRAYWYHEIAYEPILIYMEMDADRFEVRKVEIYGDGAMTWADSTHATGSSMLSYVPVPDLDAINESVEFLAETISANEFENIWGEAIRDR